MSNWKRWLVMCMWLGLCMLAVYFMKWVIRPIYEYEDTHVQLVLEKGETLIISSTVDFKGASPDHFLLLGQKGRVIESHYSPRPLGVEGDYHFTEEEDVLSDTYVLHNGGEVTVELIAEKAVKVTVIRSSDDMLGGQFSYYLVVLVVSLVGVNFIWSSTKRKKTE